MDREDTLGSFFRENKQLVEEYLEKRVDIYRLSIIRTFSMLAGRFVWLIISIILFSLLVVFMGVVTGFWLSELTGSYTMGFGLTVLILFFIILVVTMLRNILFVNPMIRFIIKNTSRKPE